MTALPGRRGEQGGRWGGSPEDTGGGSPPGSAMLSRGEGSALCDSLRPPAAAAGSDSERGRRGWINLAKQKNE